MQLLWKLAAKIETLFTVVMGMVAVVKAVKEGVLTSEQARGSLRRQLKGWCAPKMMSPKGGNVSIQAVSQLTV
jgi:hypothetical protein